MNKTLQNCRELLQAYHSEKLGQTNMPEDSNPNFNENEIEERLIYFTLPMALNYQRDSYKLWESALQTHKDPEINDVFELSKVVEMTEQELREKLLKYKLALQPNRHISIWKTISTSIYENWTAVTNLLEETNYDYLKLQKIIQKDYKKQFPYLSGPKIFNYWSYILQEYGKVKLKNRNMISIAPDTHVIQSSVKLGLITISESRKLSRDEIAEKWRKVLKQSNIDPIDMHAPLWFWSRSRFIYNLPNHD